MGQILSRGLRQGVASFVELPSEKGVSLAAGAIPGSLSVLLSEK